MSRGKGEGSIFYEPERSRYVATIELPAGLGGKRRRRKVVGRTRKQVATRLRALRDEAEAGVDIAHGRATIADLFDEFERLVINEDASSSTRGTTPGRSTRCDR